MTVSRSHLLATLYSLARHAPDPVLEDVAAYAAAEGHPILWDEPLERYLDMLRRVRPESAPTVAAIARACGLSLPGIARPTGGWMPGGFR